MFLLLVLVIVTLVIFAAHCCCKILSSDKKPSVWLTVSMVILGILVVLFLIFLVFISMAEQRHNTVICSLLRLPGGTLEGFDSDVVKFVGMRGIANAFQGLNDEMNQLIGNSSRFGSISQQNLEAQADVSQNSVRSFYEEAMSKNVTNMEN